MELKVWIDADGCPVVKQTIMVCKQRGIPVIAVKNHAVQLEDDYAEIITVDISGDAVDYYIVNHMAFGDLVITQDNGLAAMVLSKKGYCMNQNGKIIDNDNIDFFLDNRHVSRVMRMQKKKSTTFKKRTQDDNVSFEKALVTFLGEQEESNHE
ncbi:MAG: DUF188 domain-containing protein [Bacillota bacterium]|nr:DUF188 domain-containing protein [Bacillota bacterium]